MSGCIELFLRVELRADVPQPVIDLLASYSQGTPTIPENLPEHEFFGTNGWRNVLLMGDFVTPTSTTPVQFWLDELDNPDQWRLIVHCSAKNRDDLFNKFLDWLIPFVDAPPGAFLGYLLDADYADELHLIYNPPASEGGYLNVLAWSPDRHARHRESR